MAKNKTLVTSISRPFTIKEVGYNESGNILNVYLGNPDEIGSEAEFIMSISEYWIPDLISSLKNYKEQK